jgi:type II secretory pathway component GspD/PulD (secretin)
VLIECALVELTTGDLDRFGVELGLIDLKQNGDFTRGFGFTSFGQSTFQDTDDDGLPDTRLPDFDNPLQGITGGIISGGDFAVPLLINALSTDDRANILSLPSVLVNNNETAVVKTEEERPTLQSNSQGTATTTSSSGSRATPASRSRSRRRSRPTTTCASTSASRSAASSAPSTRTRRPAAASRCAARSRPR